MRDSVNPVHKVPTKTQMATLTALPVELEQLQRQLVQILNNTAVRLLTNNTDLKDKI